MSTIIGTHKSERLPARLRQLLTEAYLANENVYWQQREQLVQRIPNKWVAVHNGQVVTVGEDMATVMDEVGKRGLCDAYIEKVGGETDTVFTIRRDVLNNFVTIFDGPRRMTTFQF